MNCCLEPYMMMLYLWFLWRELDQKFSILNFTDCINVSRSFLGTVLICSSNESPSYWFTFSPHLWVRALSCDWKWKISIHKCQIWASTEGVQASGEELINLWCLCHIQLLKVVVQVVFLDVFLVPPICGASGYPNREFFFFFLIKTVF